MTIGEKILATHQAKTIEIVTKHLSKYPVLDIPKTTETLRVYQLQVGPTVSSELSDSLVRSFHDANVITIDPADMEAALKINKEAAVMWLSGLQELTDDILAGRLK